jgi:hypothetical protein
LHHRHATSAKTWTNDLGDQLSALRTLVETLERDVKMLTPADPIRSSDEMTLIQEQLNRLSDETKARESAIALRQASVINQATIVHSMIVELER